MKITFKAPTTRQIELTSNEMLELLGFLAMMAEYGEVGIADDWIFKARALRQSQTLSAALELAFREYCDDAGKNTARSIQP